jgi:hypothetical protein
VQPRRTTVDSQHYSEAWGQLQNLGRALCFILLGGLPVAFLLSFHSLKLFQTPFMLTWFVAIGIAAWRYTAFRCPRCHKKFFQPNAFGYNTFLKACPHCGLAKGALSRDPTSNI